MALTPPRPTTTRQPLPSITREVSVPEMSPLVHASRRPDEADTASLGGAEMDALLAPERPLQTGPHAAAGLGTLSPAPPLAAPPEPSSPFAAPAAQPAPARRERPRITIPPSEPTVVLAPQLTAPAPAPAPPPAAPAPAATAAAPPAAFSAVMRQAATEASSPFEATRVAGSFAVGRAPPAAAAPPKALLAIAVAALLAVVVGAVVFAISLGSGTPASETAGPRPETSSPQPGTTIPQPGTPSPRAEMPSGPGGSNPASGGTPPGAGGSNSASGGTPPGAGGTPPGAGGTPPGAGGAPSAGSTPAPTGAEADARAALARLRDGIGACVRDVIGVLPGTSPAIPALMGTLKKTAYKSAPRDYRSPVFSCTKYRDNEPQRYQIQWQLVTRPSEGRGVAWVDDDDDGRPDRAFAFRAALTGKKQVELGEIGALVPVPPVMKAQE